MALLVVPCAGDESSYTDYWTSVKSTFHDACIYTQVGASAPQRLTSYKTSSSSSSQKYKLRKQDYNTNYTLKCSVGIIIIISIIKHQGGL